RERSVFSKRHCDVESGLPADSRQQCVGLLAFEDGTDGVNGKRLDIGAIGELRIGHYRRGVRVDEHDFEALVAKCLARLGSGVVKLAGLSDYYRSRSYD